MANFDKYLTIIGNLHCAKYNGKIVIAKPALLLAVVNAIEEKQVPENRFYWDENNPTFKAVSDNYKAIYQGYVPNDYLTPLFKPFYHLKFDRIWQIKTKGPCSMPVAASAGFLKEHLDYASLDEDFWTLLQSPENREAVKEILLNKYIKSY